MEDREQDGFLDLQVVFGRSVFLEKQDVKNLLKRLALASGCSADSLLRVTRGGIL